MIIGGLKRILAQSIEGILAVLLVLVFSSITLFILNALFPSGTSLRAIITGQGPLTSTDLSEHGNRKLFVVHGEQESDLTLNEDLGAKLSQLRNDVKTKRAQAIAWETAKKGKLLYDHDAVQTLNRSAALIEFDENTILNMGPNSLVIIKRLAHDPLFREKRSFTVFVEGELRGQIAETGQESVHLEIDTPGAKLRTQSKSVAKGPVDFKVSVNPDKSSTISVYKGSAEIMAKGKKVVLQADQSTKVPLNQAPLAASPLPAPVKLKTPSVYSFYYYRDVPPKVRFAWQGRARATSYHFILARDASFRDIVTDERFSKTGFIHSSLTKGDYFWKVSAFEENLEGRFSETRRFQVVQDKDPPALQVEFPPKTVYSETYILRGKAEPGARVFVGGKQVRTTRTGKFQHKLKLRPGTNRIVVEAIDLVNNVAHQSRQVKRKT